MKKFIIKSSILILSILVLLYSLQYFIDKYIKTSDLFYYQVVNDILESKIKSNLIIQGSSRAKVQFSPFILDSILKTNSCNLGMEGTGFNMQNSRFQLLIKYNPLPKYIIQNVDCYSTLQNNLFQVEQYIPYLDNEIIKEATFKAGIFNQIDFLFPCYKYTHSLFTKQIILNGIYCSIKNTHGAGAYENFSSNNSKWDSSFDSFKCVNKKGIKFKLDTSSIQLFENHLSFCARNNIKIILVYAPEYIGLQHMILNRDSIVSVYEQYSLKYNVPFLNYSNDSICLDTLNFYNSQHMNTIGVEKFNLKLANDLKKVL